MEMSEPVLEMVAGNARERLSTIEKIADADDELLVGEGALEEFQQVILPPGGGVQRHDQLLHRPKRGMR